MNPAQIIIGIVIALCVVAVSIRIYAKQQVKINELQKDNDQLKAIIKRLQDITPQLQEIENEANTESDNLDSDSDSELEFMQNDGS